MPKVAALLCVVVALLLFACKRQVAETVEISKFVRSQESIEFDMVANYSTLGESWQAEGGASSIKRIHADSKMNRVLFELKGKSNKVLWLDFSQGRQLETLELKRPLVGVDLERQRVFQIGAQASNYEALIAAKLPSFQTEKIWFNTVEDGDIFLVATHPLAEQWWFIVQSPETTVNNGGVSSVVLCKVDDAGEGHLRRIDCENLSPDCQMVCLADGSVLLNSQGFVYLATDADSQPRRIFSIPGGRRAEVFADTTIGNLGWVYLVPVNSGGGTGRSGKEELPGKLICLDLQGQVQGNIDTGSVRFSAIAGDWTNRRCLLIRDGVGIALADLEAGSLTWPLRVRDDIPLFLLPNAGQVWAMLPDAIVGIGLDELVELGPKLAADRVIDEDLESKLRPAVEAMGWKWPEIQVSPLMSQTGKLTLFDTSDPKSTWSQLDWAANKGRATSMLIARVPTITDLGILEMSEGGIDTWCRANLRALGWPQAELASSNLDKHEAHFTYKLVPSAKPPLTSGEFQVWITETAAFYSLEGATFEFPAHSIDAQQARRIVADTLAGKPGVNKDSLLVSNMPQAGWFSQEGDGWRFLPEAQEGSTPCFRLQAIYEGKQQGLFVVYLDALSGEVLHQLEDRFSPLANLGITGGKYSKVEGDE